MPFVVNLALAIRKRAPNMDYHISWAERTYRDHTADESTLRQSIGHLQSVQQEWERLTQIMASNSSPPDFNDTRRSCGLTTTDSTGIRRDSCWQCPMDMANETPAQAT